MDLLDYIIKYMNNKVEAASSIFTKTYGLSEIAQVKNIKSYAHYIGNGQLEPITNFDAQKGTLFWVRRGDTTLTNQVETQLRATSCNDYVALTYPLRAICIVKKEHLPCDNATAVDQIAQEMLHKLGGKDKVLKSAIGAVTLNIAPTGYTVNIQGLPLNKEYAAFGLDYNIQIVYPQSCIPSICDDIALPPTPSPIPRKGTIIVQDEGVVVSSEANTLNFVGSGVVATLESPGVVKITISGGGGGGSILLQTDGVDNGSQTVLNLKEGSNITLTDDGVGGVTIAASGGGTPQVNSDWNANSGVAQILNKPNLATVATSGSYTDLINQPTIPAAQIQSDWTQANNAAVDFIKNKPTITSGTVTSVDLTMPAAFTVSGNPVTTAGTLAVAAAGLSTQYIRGDGQLANFPTSTGGGSSLSYYLNGSVAQGTLDGVAFKQMSSIPVLGAGTDFTINADGYIQSFITDANVPNQLSIPAGNWNFEMYFSASSNGGSPRFYIELYKLSGGVLSLLATSSANPEFITNGTIIDLYNTALAVPSTVLLAADRLAIRVYVIHSGRTITLHTEDNHLCQVITTFSTGITALNGLTTQVQNLAVGTSGTDFSISSATNTHTFNLPTASASNRGALSSADWTTFNGKQDALLSGTNIKTINGASILGSGNLATPFELVVAASDETTALTIGTAKITFRMPRAITLTAVRASLTTAQASGNIFTVDINEGGSSILSTKLTIDNTENTSATAVTPPVISDASLADDAEMTIDIDQIGDGTATGLKVMLIGNYA
jgi:hypothetical protein